MYVGAGIGEEFGNVFYKTVYSLLNKWKDIFAR